MYRISWKHWGLAFLCCMEVLYVVAQPRVIAHRGFWKTESSAQNSRTALVKADSIRCYGSEFDVWMAADGKLVVNHDRKFKGHVMEESTSKQLTSILLDNGETLPSLKAYLKQAQQHPDLQLILELKAHSTPERETAAVKQIVKMVKRYGLEKRTEYISFSLHAVKEFIRRTNAPVYYLSGDLSPQELKTIGCTGLDYALSEMRKHPEWIDEAHRLGLKVNVWTVNERADLEWLISKGVDFITTNEPVLLQSLLKENK